MRIQHADDIDAVMNLLPEDTVQDLRNALLRGNKVWLFRTPQEFRNTESELMPLEVEKCLKAFEKGEMWVLVFRWREAEPDRHSIREW